LTMGSIRPQGRDRKIYARLAVRVRELADQGASAADIAAALDLDPGRVLDFLRRLQSTDGKRLARPRSQAKQRRIDNPRPRAPRPPKPPKQPKPKALDAWKAAALEDPRYRDPTAPLEPPAAAIAVDLTNQAGAAELGPGPAAAKPVRSTWSGSSSIHAGRRCKITAGVLDQARKLHEAGSSWPAIARRFGCHRMAFYHALRRPPQ
jgi:hypothetical protein